jgi:hypothetical protein
MVCNTQNHWVSGLCPSSGILNSREHNVSETGSVSVLRWERGVIEVQRLRLAHSKGLYRVGGSLPWPEDRRRSRFQNVVFSSIKNSWRWTNSRNPVILRTTNIINFLMYLFYFFCILWLSLASLFHIIRMAPPSQLVQICEGLVHVYTYLSRIIWSEQF